MRGFDRYSGFIAMAAAAAALTMASVDTACASHRFGMHGRAVHAGSWRVARFGARDAEGLRFGYGYGGHIRRVGYPVGYGYGYGYGDLGFSAIPHYLGGSVYPYGYYQYPYGYGAPYANAGSYDRYGVSNYGIGLGY